MHSLFDFLLNADVTTIATDPRVLFIAAVLFILAVIFKWKAVLLLLFAAGGILAVLHYSKITQGQAEIGGNIYIFAGGTLVIGFVLIYFFFMRGD
ncbi:MAG: hypothetical protein M1550_03735 [Deltaproteobacteria bacterium]|nr:hypothetical protein [Deltaproteobacteria bacterium]